MNTPKTSVLDRVLETINEIVKKSSDGDYIYRGETKDHGEVSSSLYRVFPKVEEMPFNIARFQENVLEEAKAYLRKTDDIDETDTIGILTQLQHFGGKTNLIDFTEDYLIALFFACDGSHEKDGQVILLKRESESEPYKVKTPQRKITRVESQKSVFVESPDGFVTPDRKVTIPADLKEPILDYLKKHHRISIETIYNDLHGFIRRSAQTEFLNGFTYQRKVRESETNQEKHEHCENAIKHYTEALKLKSNFADAYHNRGVAYGEKGDFDAAIEDFNTAIELDPKDAQSYTNRGVSYAKKGDFDTAIENYSKAIELAPQLGPAYYYRGLAYNQKGYSNQALRDYSKAIALNPKYASAYHNRGVIYAAKGDFDTAIEDFNKAIALKPENAKAYTNRGEAWLHLRDWEKAKDDLTVAKDRGGDIIASFHIDYKSVQDFEAKHKVKLPETIAALLQGTESGDKIIRNGNKVGIDVSERQRQCINFWTGLRDYMKDSQLPFPFPSPSRYSVLTFRMRRAEFSLQPYFRTRDKAIGITLYVRGVNATALFHWLKDQQAAIENEFGEPLEWEETPEDESNKIYLRKEETDPGDERNWPQQHEWLASRLELFYDVFLPRIQVL